MRLSMRKSRRKMGGDARAGGRLLLSMAALCLTAGLCFPASSRGADPAPPPAASSGLPPATTWIDTSTKEIGGSFSLTDQDGRRVTEKDYSHLYKLVFFGYTFCPGTCPMALTKLSRSLERLGKDADQIVILFITTDPERDKPDVMKKYLAKFSSRRIVGLTGTREEIEATEKKFRIFAEKVEDPRFKTYT